MRECVPCALRVFSWFPGNLGGQGEPILLQLMGVYRNRHTQRPHREPVCAHCSQHLGFGLPLHFCLELSCSKLGSDVTSPGKPSLTPGCSPVHTALCARELASILAQPSPLLSPEHLDSGGVSHTVPDTHKTDWPFLAPRPIPAPPPTSSVAFSKSHLLPRPQFSHL